MEENEIGKSPVIRFHEVDSRKKMKEFLEVNTLIDCKVPHQHSEVFKSLKEKYNTNSTGICGYVACAVARYLCDNIKSSYYDNIDDFINLCVKINDDIEILSYVEDAMKFIQTQRTEVIGKNYQNKMPENGWVNNWMQGWVSNYEISDYMNIIKHPNLFFFRWNQIRDIQNIEKDMKRGDPVGFFEFDRIKEEYALNLYESDPDFCFIESLGNSLLTLDKWKETFRQEISTSDIENGNKNTIKITPKVFIVDCVGHYTAAITLTIKYRFKTLNKLIMFNSLWEENIFSLECNDLFCIENYFHGPRYEAISKTIYDNVFN